ncbi:MAG: DUF3761 domain-containing protein [Xanthobacteraceae bacterium]
MFTFGAQILLAKHCQYPRGWRHRSRLGATVLCRDGIYGFSQHHRGTCSHHLGLAEWLTRRADGSLREAA